MPLLTLQTPDPRSIHFRAKALVFEGPVEQIALMSARPDFIQGLLNSDARRYYAVH